MADLVVIYDTDKELAAIVNLDDQVAFGPAMVGPNADTILQAWLDATPFDLSETDTYTARSFFRSFLQRVAHEASPPAEQDHSVAPFDGGSPGVDDAALADHENAAMPTEPVPAAPANADVEADQGEAPELTPCPHCGGHGTIIMEDGGLPVTCPLCQGARYVRIPA